MKKLRSLLTLVLSLTMLCSVSVPVQAVQKTFEVGKQDPKEVVATVDSTTKQVVLACKYVYDASNTEAEELPNPGYMSDQRLTDLLSYMENNNLLDYELVVMNGVKSIGTNAFSGSSAFKTITINSSTLEKIGANAFANMPNLDKVNLGNINVNRIEANTFSDTPLLTTITLPNSIKQIDAGAFQNSGITVIEGGHNVANVGAGAFSGSKIMQINSNSEAIKGYDWANNGYDNVTNNGTAMYLVEIIPGLSMPNTRTLVTSGETIKAPSVENDNYTLEGWFEDAAFTKPFNFNNPISSSVKVYGKWHGNNVTITFDAQNNMTSAQQIIPYGGKAEKPNDPINGDKVFIGWFKDTGFVTPVDFSKDVFDKDTTVYAKYVDATYFTVEFDTDGADEINSQTVKAGKTAFRPTDPEKDDYTFDGWYSSKEFTDKWDFDKDAISSDTTIYAKWKSNYVTVKFETNGGGNIPVQSVERGTAAKQPETPVKDNCEFLGWFTDSGATEVYNFDSKVSEDLVLYAGWNQTAFTVSFESNGGSAVSSVVTNPNTLIAKPLDPIKEGYHLEAWCSDSGLTTAWDFNVNQVSSDITLYAKWAPGSTPGVTNTGAAVPQTGDPTSALGVIGSLAGTIAAGYLSYKRNSF